MTTPRLHAFAVFVAVMTFILVIAGGLVTSTGSALAVPDWPLAFGQFFPKMEGGVLYEHGHRMIAGVVAMLTVVMAVWIWLSNAGSLLNRLAGAAVGAVLAQALLGGATVLLKLPPAVSIAHATLGQLFFSINVCIAVMTGLRARMPWQPQASAMTRKMRLLSILTLSFIFLQLVVGAVFRHTGMLFHLHLLGAVLVLVHVILVARRVFKHFPDEPDLERPALILISLLGVQLALGFFSWRTGAVWVVTGHVGVGALLLATSAVLTLQTYRRLSPL